MLRCAFFSQTAARSIPRRGLLLWIALSCLSDRSLLAGAADAGTNSSARAPCAAAHAAVGLTGELAMEGRQLRGRVTVLDDCTLAVRALETSPGAPLWWWLDTAPAPTSSARSGLLLSDTPIEGGESGANRTFTLRRSVQWRAAQTLFVLTSPDPSAAQVAGRVVLVVGEEAPRAPTMFDNCLELSPSYRVRWSLDAAAGAVEVGLEGVVPEGSAMAFGPAVPGTTNRLMGGSDVVVAGYEGAQPFAIDYYMSAYVECYEDGEGGVEGVCEDSAWGGGSLDFENVQMLYAHRLDGATFVRYRRALVTNDSAYDHPLQPGVASQFVWGMNAVEARSGVNLEGPHLLYHGQVRGYNYDELFGLDLGAPQHACRPLEGLAADVAPGGALAQEPGFTPFVPLHGRSVLVSWRLDRPANKVTFDVRSQVSGGWVSLALGKQMVGAHAYVAWMDEEGQGRVSSYYMASQAASGMQEVQEALEGVEVRREGGAVAFRFTRPLNGTQGTSPRGAPSIDAARAVALIWAAGTSWRAGALLEADTHFDRSALTTFLDLSTGAASFAEVDARLTAHSWLMFLAWGVLLPGAILAARYLKAYDNAAWLKLHTYLMWAALGTMGAGVALAVAEEWADGQHLRSMHSRVGVAALVLAALNPLNAATRPKPQPAAPSDGPASAPLRRAAQGVQEVLGSRRRQWEVGHRALAMAAVGLAVAAMYSGIEESRAHGVRDIARLDQSLTMWLVAVVVVIVVREVMVRQEASAGRRALQAAGLQAAGLQAKGAPELPAAHAAPKQAAAAAVRGLAGGDDAGSDSGSEDPAPPPPAARPAPAALPTHL